MAVVEPDVSQPAYQAPDWQPEAAQPPTNSSRRREATVKPDLGEDAIPEYAQAVLDVVGQIPPGRVMSYGDVAEYLGRGGPRQVGQVMAVFGHEEAWHRVIYADGTPPPGYGRMALERWAAEGTPVQDGRADMRHARWDGRSS